MQNPTDQPSESITCPFCGMTSYHRGDIRHRYCGNCDRFHVDMRPFPMQNELEELRQENRELKRVIRELAISTQTIETVLKRLTKEIRMEEDVLAMLLATTEVLLRKEILKHPEIIQNTILNLSIPIENIDLTISD